MHIITFVNRTCAEEDFAYSTIYHIMVIEVALLVYSFFLMCFCYHLLFNTVQYHRNLSWIFANYASQYLVSIVSRITLITMQWQYSGENLLENTTFQTFTLIRTFCLFTAFINISGIVFERSMATILVQDYESLKRRWIPATCIPIVYLGSSILTYVYIYNILPVFHVVCILQGLNVINLVISCTTEQYTLRQIDRRTRRVKTAALMTLGERYQQVENLKSWELMRYVIMVICLFNLICDVCMLIPEFFDTCSARNIASVTFDFAAVLYGIVVPAVCLYFNKIWQREVFRIMRKCGLSFLLPHVRSPTLRNTSGENMNIEIHEHRNHYFTQLHQDWNRP